MESGTFDQDGERAEIFTVSRLNREARTLLETGFSSVRVEGELRRDDRAPGGFELGLTGFELVALLVPLAWRRRRRT